MTTLRPTIAAAKNFILAGVFAVSSFAAGAQPTRGGWQAAPAQTPAPAPAPAQNTLGTVGEYETIPGVPPGRERAVAGPQQPAPKQMDDLPPCPDNTDKKIAGAIFGSIAGASVGRQIGKGDGKRWATFLAAGAGFLGGYKAGEIMAEPEKGTCKKYMYQEATSTGPN